MSDTLSRSEKLSTPADLEEASHLSEKVKAAVTPQPPHDPNPEVNPSKQRRRFTAKYKLNILDELDRCTVIGGKGAVIRREGLYSSQITDWRRQREEGALSALNKIRGRKSQKDAKDEKIVDLENEMLSLKNKLAQAEAIIEVQKKVSEIFGISHPSKKNSETNS